MTVMKSTFLRTGVNIESMRFVFMILILFNSTLVFAKKSRRAEVKAFFTVSLGVQDETGLTGGTLKENQNSPGTLGVNISNSINKKSSLQGSVYVSYLNSSKNKNSSTSSGTADPPLELGLNSYYRRKWGERSALFTGVDFERFSVFNTDDIASNSTIAVDFRKQTLGYFTFGYDRKFYLGKTKFSLRTSVSMSVFSAGDKNPLNGETYSGKKFIAYLAAPITKKWGWHSFVKYHDLHGPGELTMARMGLGVDLKL